MTETTKHKKRRLRRKWRTAQTGPGQKQKARRTISPWAHEKTGVTVADSHVPKDER